jgi:glycosyltransferase involved in cell wall biosynthesis
VSREGAPFGDASGHVLLLQGTSGFGGSKVSLLALIDVLAGSGLTPVVACRERGWLTTELERRATAYVLVPFPAWRKLLERPRVAGTVRRRWVPAVGALRPALVHSNEFWWAPHAALLGAALKVPVVVHLRDGLHTLAKARQYRLDRADRVLAVSTELRERFVADPALHAKTSVVYSGHREWPRADDVQRAAWRGELGIAPDDLAIGNAGRVCERKNQRLLLAALADARRQGRLGRFKAVLVGETEPAYERLLRADAARLGLEREVVVAGPRPDLERFFAAVDMVVHCARREGLPRVIPEAMLARRPVVATAAEGARDAIPDDRHGLVVAGDDPAALGAAIAAMAEDAPRRARVAEMAYARARALFSLDAHRASILQVYGGLLDRASAVR